MMDKFLGTILLLLCLQGCSENADPIGQLHTSFSESSGLIVTQNNGEPQQLIAESLGVRVVVSPSAKWIVVEDMQLSNLVVIRAFHRTGNAYQEVPLPEIRRQWEVFAQNAGVSVEDLTRARVGIEEFGPREKSLLLRFQAAAVTANSPDLDAVMEIRLD